MNRKIHPLFMVLIELVFVVISHFIKLIVFLFYSVNPICFPICSVIFVNQNLNLCSNSPTIVSSNLILTVRQNFENYWNQTTVYCYVLFDLFFLILVSINFVPMIILTNFHVNLNSIEDHWQKIFGQNCHNSIFENHDFSV